VSNIDSLLRRTEKVELKVRPPARVVARLPMVMYDPETEEPLPEYAEQVQRWERLGMSAKYYGFNPDEDGCEP